MIGFIRGKIVYKWETGVLVDVHGVGYEVHMPGSMVAALPSSSAEEILHTHLVWREDTVTLYGFDTRETRDMFRLLLDVSGVGPRLALNILSMLSARELIEILARGENKRLQAVHGVGKKTAARLCVDLKERAKNILGRDILISSDTAEGAGIPARGNVMGDALSALVNLGYRTREAQEALLKVQDQPGGDLELEDLVKKALKILAGDKGA